MIDRLQPFVPQRAQQPHEIREQPELFDLGIGPALDRLDRDRFDGALIAQDAGSMQTPKTSASSNDSNYHEDFLSILKKQSEKSSNPIIFFKRIREEVIRKGYTFVLYDGKDSNVSQDIHDGISHCEGVYVDATKKKIYFDYSLVGSDSKKLCGLLARAGVYLLLDDTFKRLNMDETRKEIQNLTEDTPYTEKEKELHYLLTRESLAYYMQEYVESNYGSSVHQERSNKWTSYCCRPCMGEIYDLGDFEGDEVKMLEHRIKRYLRSPDSAEDFFRLQRKSCREVLIYERQGSMPQGYGESLGTDLRGLMKGDFNLNVYNKLKDLYERQNNPLLFFKKAYEFLKQEGYVFALFKVPEGNGGGQCSSIERVIYLDLEKIEEEPKETNVRPGDGLVKVLSHEFFHAYSVSSVVKQSLDTKSAIEEIKTIEQGRFLPSENALYKHIIEEIIAYHVGESLQQASSGKGYYRDAFQIDISERLLLHGLKNSFSNVYDLSWNSDALSNEERELFKERIRDLLERRNAKDVVVNQLRELGIFEEPLSESDEGKK